ncbi:MAG TPA: hypothetical protein DEA96_03245 [Leptospiraceae bacterium]|nr:hypothetical protein [Leptospiraceae bacterium]
MILSQLLIHTAFLFSLLRAEAPAYLFFQILGMYVMVPATLGLGWGFKMTRKDSLRDCMSFTLPAGLLGGALGFLLYLLFPGVPGSMDLSFLIWVLVFMVSFALFLLSRQLFRRHQHLKNGARSRSRSTPGAAGADQ